LLNIDFLPEGLLSIGGEAFRNCTGLTSLAFPATLDTIGGSAFEGCTSLTGLALPATLATIEAAAFRNCTGLTELALPAALASIGASAFENCTGLSTLVVPESVTQIGDGAFWGCQSLTSVSLPERFLASVANIGLDYNAGLATDTLIAGIANNLAKNPAFVTKLANEIISKTGHYGLSTQNDVTALAAMTPQTTRSPAPPIGWVVWSSALAWITIAEPSASHSHSPGPSSAIRARVVNSSAETEPSAAAKILGRSPSSGPPAFSRPCGLAGMP
jgi:hypothetical protein